MRRGRNGKRLIARGQIRSGVQIRQLRIRKLLDAIRTNGVETLAFHGAGVRLCRLATGNSTKHRLSAPINSFETQIKPSGYFPLFDRAINRQRRGVLRRPR